MTRLNSGQTESRASTPAGDAEDSAQKIGLSPADYSYLPVTSRFGENSLGHALPATSGAVFLDRDGVIVEDVNHLTEPGQLNVLPGVCEAISQLQDKFYVVVVTNQSGIARGLFSEETLLAVHTELARQLSTQGSILDCVYYCPHLEGAAISEYDTQCDCRKPNPGMLLRAAEEWGIDLTQSFLVGDRRSDVKAGQNAGVTPIKIGESAADGSTGVTTVTDLLQAAAFILA